MDNDNEINYLDNVSYILSLVRNKFGDTLNAFYEGDPLDIPKNNYPCFIIEKISTKSGVQNAPTGHDRVDENISMRVVYNKADDINAAIENTDLTERKLRKIIEGRDQNGQYTTNSLMYALRSDITLGDAILNQDVDITYGLNPRSTDVTTSEAQLIITISQIVRVVR